MSVKKNIVVLVSGGGTNLQALIDAEHRGEIPNGRITCVISSKADAYALERAKQNNIKTRARAPTTRTSPLIPQQWYKRFRKSAPTL